MQLALEWGSRYSLRRYFNGISNSICTFPENNARRKTSGSLVDKLHTWKCLVLISDATPRFIVPHFFFSCNSPQIRVTKCWLNQFEKKTHIIAMFSRLPPSTSLCCTHWSWASKCRQCVYVSVLHVFVHVPLCIYLCVSVYMCVCLPVYMTVHVSVYIYE